MLEPPVDLPDATLWAALRTAYGLDVAGLTFLPLGHDSSAWAYRVDIADGAPYFLKVRLSITNPPGLLVPRYLHDQGVAQVVAPLPTTDRTLWAEVDGYVLLLYPFVKGRTGMEQGMAPHHWIAFGALLRQIHATAVAPDLAAVMRRETFVPEGTLVRDLDARIDGGAFADPAAQVLAGFWQAQRTLIRTLTARAEELGRRLAQTAPPFVLCHADMHTNNVMLDTSGQVWIVDWDETVLAPRERDLMFVLGGGISTSLVGPGEEELFRQSYGPAAVDPLALAYYRFAWAVSDIGAWAHQILSRPDLGAITQRAAVDSFMGLFLPGNIVALALASEEA